MVSAVEVFDERPCELGEGPSYDDRTGQFRWIDIMGSRVLWRSVEGTDGGDLPTPGHVGAAVPRANGGLVLCLPEGPALRDPDGTVTPVGTYADADTDAGHPAPPGAPAMRSNDAKADPAGRLWLGTMAYDQTSGAAALYRLEPGARRPERVVGGATISNGLGWSADGTRMYYIDTPTGRVDVFDYDPATGTPAHRRPFVTIAPGDGSPDGMCMDAADGIWVALHSGGAVRRYAPDGTLDRVVALPTPLVTSCAFGGAAYDMLIITTAVQGRTDDPGAGRTYVHRPGDVVGLPAHRYDG
ncbi:MAG TPA: SMP-30/gluconolactonase/LRE family protein [Micromonosporaceae bacterium]|nr:SMP-30/gluconolactonase/LRE family protein [Micromonosporaceae bacterium]